MEIKNLEEAQKIVFDILIQGDSRYYNSKEELILANLLFKNAINLERVEVDNKINELSGNKLGIQHPEKHFAREILKEKGFKDEEISFETLFNGARVDVLAESKSKIVFVECCSCRVNKIQDYLFEPNSEVWIIIRDELPWMNENKTNFFIFRRGENWSLVEDLKKQRIQELKKIKSPLDI